MTAESSEYQYESMDGFVELSYFDRDDEGRLVVADPTIGPIVDVHTHLSFSFIRKRLLDLHREGEPTEHYLRIERPVDLDIYANQNIRGRDLTRMRRDLGIGSLTRRGMRRTHTVPNLLREMQEMGVVRSLILPIEMPWLSHNATAYLEVARQTEGLLSMGSVHPMAKNIPARLEEQKAQGACGIKIHPAVQMICADHPKAMIVYRLCADLKLPVLWHCGPVGIEPKAGRKRSQLKHYWQAVHDNPDTTFILGHSGALQMELALHLAQSYPNVYMEISSQSLSAVRRIVAEAPPERVLFGSDWPFYHQALPLAKLCIATEGNTAQRRRVLWENSAELFGLDTSAALGTVYDATA